MENYFEPVFPLAPKPAYRQLCGFGGALQGRARAQSREPACYQLALALTKPDPLATRTSYLGCTTRQSQSAAYPQENPPRALPPPLSPGEMIPAAARALPSTISLDCGSPRGIGTPCRLMVTFFAAFTPATFTVLTSKPAPAASRAACISSSTRFAPHLASRMVCSRAPSS
jgi:hypothetical protein